jgi:hypothetical protein
MKRLLLTSLIVLSACYSSNAQTTAASDQQINIKTKNYAEEVYKDYTAYTSPTHLALYEENLSRVEVKTVPASSTENYTLLSSIDLKNKYNPQLTRDNAGNFNPSQFNALKYFFDFYPKQDKIYRVDNTQYLIVIHAKH